MARGGSSDAVDPPRGELTAGVLITAELTAFELADTFLRMRAAFRLPPAYRHTLCGQEDTFDAVKSVVCGTTEQQFKIIIL